MSVTPNIKVHTLGRTYEMVCESKARYGVCKLMLLVQSTGKRLSLRILRSRKSNVADRQYVLTLLWSYFAYIKGAPINSIWT
jgi:hypothetical protein